MSKYLICKRKILENRYQMKQDTKEKPMNQRPKNGLSKIVLPLHFLSVCGDDGWCQRTFLEMKVCCLCAVCHF